MKKKQIICSLIMNILIFLMVLLGTIFMIFGITFMTNTQVLTARGFSILKYYTVDSNIFVGIASLIFIFYEICLLNKKITKIPKFVYLLKYIGTVAVSLTFLVTLFYLTPSYGENFWFLYQNSNLLFHLLVPVISFISFGFFEKNDMKFKHTFWGVSTMIIYGIYYMINAIIHQENGIVSFEYDWYGFLKGGIFSIVIVFPIMIGFTYLISLIIYKINKRR